MLRVIRWIVLTLLLLTVLLIAFVAWGLGTSSGLTTLARFGVGYVPGAALERVEGNLGDFTLIDAAYEMEGVTVKVGRARLAVDLGALWNNRLIIEAVEVADADVAVDTAKLPASEPAADDASATAVAMPEGWAATLNALTLTNIRASVDGTDVRLGSFTTGADFRGNDLTVLPTTLAELALLLPPAAPVEAAPVPEAPKTLKWRRPGEDEAGARVDPATLPPLVDMPALRAVFEKPLLASLPEVTIPLGVKAESIDVAQVVVRQRVEGASGDSAEAEPATLVNLQAAAIEDLRVTTDPEVSIGSLKLETPEGAVTLSGGWTLHDDWKGKVDFKADLREAAFARVGVRMEDLSLRAMTREEQTALALGDASKLSGGVGTEPVGLEATLEGSLAGRLALNLAMTGGADAHVLLEAVPGEPGLPFLIDAELPRAALRIPAQTAPTAQSDQTAQAESKAAAAAEASESAESTEPAEPAQAALSTPTENTPTEKSSESSDAPQTSAQEDGGAALENLRIRFEGRADDWKGALTASVRASLPGTLATPVAAGIEGAFSGSLAGAKIERFDAVLPEGRIKLNLDAAWGQQLDATGRFETDKIDLKPYVPQVPSAFAAGFDFKVRLRSNGHWRVGVEGLNVESELQGAPVKVAGDVAMSSRGWAALSGVELRLGRNVVSVNGVLRGLQAVDLEAKLNVPGLENTLPGLAGKASGHLALRGPTLRPEVDADIRAEGIRYGNVSIGNIQVKGDVHPRTKASINLKDQEALRRAVEAFEKLDAVTQFERAFSAAEMEGTIRIALSNLQVEPEAAAAPAADAAADTNANTDAAKVGEADAALRKAEADAEKLRAEADAAEDGADAADDETAPLVAYDSIVLATSGRESAHTITLTVKGRPVSLDMAWSGALDRNTFAWKGMFEKGVITTPAGDWTLREPSAMRFDPAKTELAWDPSAWTHAHALVTFPETVRLGTKGVLKVRLEELNLDVLQPYLKRRERLSGYVKGEFKADWDIDKNVIPNADWAFDADGLAYSTRVDGVRLPVTLEALRLTGTVRPEHAILGWTVKPEGTGGVEGNLTIEDPAGERRMKGRVVVSDMTPVLLKPLLSKGERAEGVFAADLTAGGTLEAPRIWGDLTLKGVELDAGFVPFEMNPSEIALRFEGDRSTLTGRISTAEGDLILDGRASWPTAEDWTASVHAAMAEDAKDGKGAKGGKGKLRITLPPMIDLDLLPDVRASADKNAVILSGRVDVPRARVTVEELPASTVDVSKDEVVLDENLKPVKEASAPFPLKSRIAVGIGDDVRMDAFGLQARLTGELFVLQDERGLGLNGQIKVPGGRFHAYGQDLIVRDGSIVFGGDPTNPNFRIEAIRNPDVTEDGVTVGVRVTGTAASPKVELFSDPTKPQQEMLSYLLRGQGLEGGSGEDNSAMTSMLVGLGAATGGQVLGKIGDVVGIEDLGVDTTGVGDSAQVVVSGYILPGLQLKYGIGIFDSLATLTLRYRLMPRLYLEAVSGVSQALDLLYRFEFD